MRTLPEDKYDFKQLKELKAEDWMIKCLEMNPPYVHWGNHEDYMNKRDRGWETRLSIQSMDEVFDLDDYNECVHFYFQLNRTSKDCENCHGSGYNKETYQLSEDFYDFEETGRKWNDNINQDEVESLQKRGRLQVYDKNKQRFVKRQGLTAEEVNEANKSGGLGDLNHDGINRFILIETRAKRLGVYGKCSNCKGKGYLFTEPKAKLQLQLWILHPRKGASRGILVEDVKREDVKKAVKYLKGAAKRNMDRFEKVKNIRG